MNIGNLRIGTRLTVGFRIVLLMLSGVATLDIVRMATLQSQIEYITMASNVESHAATAMRFGVSNRMLALRNIVLLEDPSAIDAEAALFDEHAKRYADAETKLKAALDQFGATSDETEALAKIKAAADAAAPVMQKVIALGKANDKCAGHPCRHGRAQAPPGALEQRIDGNGHHQDHAQRCGRRGVRRGIRHCTHLTLALSALAILFGVAIAWFITRSINYRQLALQQAYCCPSAPRCICSKPTSRRVVKRWAQMASA